MKLVAVTACPTGIAHTYMAAAQLEKTAKKLGHTIKVETQGAMGIENELSQGVLGNEKLLAKSIRHGEIVGLLNEKELKWLELSEK